MKDIYLDNSATTRPYDEVIEKVSEVMREAYGNPSSLHNAGVKAENYIKEAKEEICKALRCKDKEILFTSGGTESDNMAIIGGAFANIRRGKHLITTKIEHPAILETMKYMESQGFSVTYLPVDESGLVREEDLKNALREDTTLVTIMHVNNEIGALEPIEKLGKIIKAYNKSILFHVDSVQGFSKVKIIPKDVNVDLLSISGHKLHGPKGIGILYIKEGTKINPIVFGGGQQKGMRSGTENVPGIAGIGEAIKKSFENFDEKINKLYELKAYFIEELLKLEDVKVNGLIKCEGGQTPTANIKLTAPHIISASFKNVRSEVLLHSLEDKNIYVSSGSACASNKPHTSETLLAIGLENNLLDSTIRFSMSTFTEKEDIDAVIKELSEIVPVLRRFVRR